MMQKILLKFAYLLVGVVIVLVFSQNESQARSFRPSLIPNGNINTCDNCHVFPGGPRLGMGLEVQKLVSRGGREEFWGAALAQLDSDGDGVPNGVELQDPAGTWRPGDPNPGNPALVTNPSDPEDFPELGPSSPADAWLAVLSGKGVVPVVDTNARGTAIIKLHEPEKKVTYFLNVFDIENITAAHIHLGPSDGNGPVAHPLETPTEGVSSGTIDVSDEDIQNLKSGQFYVQVHTQQNPPGEIRGQLVDEPLEFVAKPDSSQVVGSPVQSNGSGEMKITLNEDMNKINYTLTVANLSGITAAHIHEGARGENGGVIIPLADGPFTELSGEVDLTEEQLEDLLSERFYVNIHTQANPAGEIRGQIMFDAPAGETSSVSSWSFYD